MSLFLFESLTENIDKATFPSVYDEFVEFSKNGIVVVLLVGNHDWLDRTKETKCFLYLKYSLCLLSIRNPQPPRLSE